jgi:Zn-dependent oligopeptidase
MVVVSSEYASRYPTRGLWAFSNRHEHVAAYLLGFERYDEMEVASNAADEVHTKQVENLLSPLLNVSKIGRRLVFRVKQSPQAAPMQRVTTFAVERQQLALG